MYYIDCYVLMPKLEFSYFLLLETQSMVTHPLFPCSRLWEFNPLERPEPRVFSLTLASKNFLFVPCVLTRFFLECIRNPVQTLDVVLLKESCYRALTVSCSSLHKEIDFEAFFCHTVRTTPSLVWWTDSYRTKTFVPSFWLFVLGNTWF